MKIAILFLSLLIIAYANINIFNDCKSTDWSTIDCWSLKRLSINKTKCDINIPVHVKSITCSSTNEIYVNSNLTSDFINCSSIKFIQGYHNVLYLVSNNIDITNSSLKGYNLTCNNLNVNHSIILYNKI